MVHRLACASLGALLSIGSAIASERVSFDSLDADLTAGKPTRIQADLYRPRGRGPFAAVVLLHGCGGLYRWKGRHVGQMVPRNADWAERLAAQGFVVVLPDSFRPRGVNESCTVKDRPVDSARERPRDAYGALKWLQQQSYVMGNRVAVMGWSNGGGTVLHTIAADAPVSGAALPKGGFRAAVAFYPGCSDPLTSATGRRWKTSVPLLIMQGEADDWTPAAPCRNLAAAAVARGDPVEFQSYAGAYHDFDAPDVRVHTRTGLARAPTGTAHVGTDAKARAAALVRVPAFLHDKLGT